MFQFLQLFPVSREKAWERPSVGEAMKLAYSIVSRLNEPYSVLLYALWSSCAWETVTD